MENKHEYSEQELKMASGGQKTTDVDTSLPIDSNDPRCVDDGSKLKIRGCYSDLGYDIFACTDCGKRYRHIFEGDVWTIWY